MHHTWENLRSVRYLLAVCPIPSLSYSGEPSMRIQTAGTLCHSLSPVTLLIIYEITLKLGIIPFILFSALNDNVQDFILFGYTSPINPTSKMKYLCFLTLFFRTPDTISQGCLISSVSATEIACNCSLATRSLTAFRNNTWYLAEGALLPLHLSGASLFSCAKKN